ncbi:MULTISPECIES: cyclase family protein [Niastella]|uniref:Cyclase family protein n=1 Tax=Niastella soli TaxID=2821487 RepID=A0ABS3Z2R2_9BACT|nr:cyclase family protein [Niastella soli]MBO9204457.1 cyclase family protein [Niastella soli]
MKGSILITASCFLLMAACKPAKQEDSPAKFFASGKWIDLTYSFSEQTLYWPNNPTGFKLDTQANGITPAGFYYSSNAFSAPEHGGTHLDAPVHFAKAHQTTDQVPLEHLTGGAIVIDVSERALKEADYLISVQDIEAWEKANGKIPDSTIVLFRTGYGKYYPDAKKYFGTDEKGAGAIPHLHFPGIDPAAAEWLVRRQVKAVGLDTPSIDYGQSKDFKTHQVLLAKDIPAFENVANLDQLPVTGAYIVALPMKIRNGSGGPLRIIAWVKND